MIKDLTLRKYFSEFQDAWKVKPSNERSEASVFEMFINYIILSQDDLSTFIGHPEILNLYCTGGGDDAKLDGVGIKINDQIVGSKEDIDEIVEASKKIKVEFFIIQSKECSEFDSSALNTFGLGVKNFFSEPIFPENDKVRALRELKDYIFNEEKVYRKLTENPAVNIYYVFCGVTPNDEHTNAVKKLLIEGLSSCPDCLGEKNIEIVDGKGIIKRCKDLENDFSTELNIRDIIPLTVNENNLIKKAYAFTCEASELLKLLTREDGSLRRSLFNSNVRDYLGNKSSVNGEIENTLSNEPAMFLMCNNGITIVCSDFIQIKDKLVSIDNPQIVNGCQTCSTIFMQKSNPSISSVQVLVKLICTEDNTIINKIVRGTNKQNQVLEESFETTKPFHQDIEDYFEAKNNNRISLHYERRNKQYSSMSTISRYQIVNLRILTQTFVAVFLQKPHEAHYHEARLLQLYAKDENQREIYNPNHSPYPYYIAALIWYKFEDAMRRNVFKDKKELRPYMAHLYYIFSFTTGQYPLNAASRDAAMDRFCEKLENALLSEAFNDTAKKVADMFEECKREWIKSGHSRFNIKDNKEFTERETQMARCAFVNKAEKLRKKPETADDFRWISGVILSVRYTATHWFAFIKTKECEQNVYFDHKSYKGEERKLIPKTPVRFIMNAKEESGEVKYFAIKVEIE